VGLAVGVGTEVAVGMGVVVAVGTGSGVAVGGTGVEVAASGVGVLLLLHAPSSKHNRIKQIKLNLSRTFNLFSG
jgi:hypothetical protein